MTDKYSPTIEGKRLECLRRIRDNQNLDSDDVALDWCIALAHEARNGVKIFRQGEWVMVEPRFHLKAQDSRP
jgi:hypothetical protein